MGDFSRGAHAAEGSVSGPGSEAAGRLRLYERSSVTNWGRSSGHGDGRSEVVARRRLQRGWSIMEPCSGSLERRAEGGSGGA